jgi:hypothetical protein
MTYAFVPIPTSPIDLFNTRELWLPFVEAISRRSKEPLADMIDAIRTGRAQIALVWDEKKKEAQALVGMQFRQRGPELIGEIHWLTGRGMKEWQHLLPQMERYLKEHMGCSIIKPICRPGWSRLLKKHGYKTTHHIMERAL